MTFLKVSVTVPTNMLVSPHFKKQDAQQAITHAGHKKNSMETDHANLPVL
jgi:hypothetical protein